MTKERFFSEGSDPEPHDSVDQYCSLQTELSEESYESDRKLVVEEKGESAKQQAEEDRWESEGGA